jgi:hypothetical protein
MTPAAGLRIGDADREATAESLREHFAQGRLTLEEFRHRLGAAFGAKTDRDLAAITNDLPAPSPSGFAGSGPAGDSRGADRMIAGRSTRAVGRATDASGWQGAGGWQGPSGWQGPGGRQGAAGAGQRSWPRAVAGLIVIILTLVAVAVLLPLALFGAALSRSVLFVLAMLLFGRRGLLGWLRRWLTRSRRWPF